MKKPQKMTLESLWNVYNGLHRKGQKAFYSRNGIAVILNKDVIGVFHHFVKTQTPYLIEDYRCGIVTNGTARIVINLTEYRFVPGMLAFVTPGCILEPLEVSNDFQIIGMGISNDVFHLVHNDRIPPLFNGEIQDGRLRIEPQETHFVSQLFDLLWQALQSVYSTDETTQSILSSITWHYDAVFSRARATESKRSPAGHTLFRRFIELVNKHCKEQHRLEFYARELCVTDRYLGTVVHRTSGIMAKTWIDRAVTAQAKVLLRHSDKPITEITDELHFPNPSFFCKYFKRMTGCTPQNYRNGTTGQTCPST